MSDNVVTLGAREYILVPQPHAIILRKFPEVVNGVSGLSEVDDTSAQSLVTALGDRVHDALKLFIPNLMPKFEFMGFATKQAMEADEFDEDFAKEHAPTLPEIFHAFDVALAVNGGKRLANILGNALGPEMKRALQQFVVAQMRLRLSQMSLNSLSPSGESDQTSSGANAPTQVDEEELASVA